MINCSGYLLRYSFLPIALIGMVSFHNVFGNSFHFDDGHSIIDNEHIRNLQNIPSFFVDPSTFSAHPQARMYRPILLCTYSFNYALDGYNTRGYHLINIVLHLVNAFLVCLLARRLNVLRGSCVISGLIFVCHPVLTQAINYVSSRSSVLVTFFSLIALNGMVRERYGILVTGYLFALLSKSIAIVIPIVIFFRVGIKGAKRIFTQRPILLIVVFLTILYLLFTASIIDSAIFSPVRDYGSHYLTQIKAIIFYFYKTLFPYPLSIEPAFRVSTRVYELVVFSSLTVLASFFWVMFFCRPPKLFEGIQKIFAFYVLCLLPTAIVPLNILVNEHRLYFPMVAGSIALAILIRNGFRYRWIGWLLCLIMVAHCIQRNEVWKSEVSIWNDAITKGPQMVRPMVNLGKALLEAEEFGQSIEVGQRVLKLAPDTPLIHFNLGTAYLRLGQLLDAKYHLNKSIELNGPKYQAYNNLAAVYLELKDVDAALEIYRNLLAEGSQFELLHNMGKAQLQAGHNDSARYYFRRTLFENPRHRQGYVGAIQVSKNINDTEDLVSTMDEILFWLPRDEEIQGSLAVALDRLGIGSFACQKLIAHGWDRVKLYGVLAKAALGDGRWLAAKRYSEKMIKMQASENPETLNDLGVAFFGIGDTQAALYHFRYAARVAPDYAAAYFNIARVLLVQAQGRESLAAIIRALYLKPQEATYHALKGRINEFIGENDEALMDYKNAVYLDMEHVGYKLDLGLLHQKMGRHKLAERSMLEALKDDSTHVETLESLGNLYMEDGRTGRARKMFNLAETYISH